MLKLAGIVGGAVLATQLVKNKVSAETLPWQTGAVHAPGSLDYSWLLEKREDAVPASTGQSKLLLLAYPRTGSSLLGELLSSSPGTSYFMEPLFALMSVGELDWEYALEGRVEQGEVPGEAVTSLMEGIYSCDNKVVGRLGEWSRVPDTSVTAVPTKECSRGKAVLTKTVRLHGAQLADAANRIEDLRVVHLVRDPRGTVASLKAQSEEWGGRTGETYCRQVLSDMAVGEQLGPNRYIRIAYEDLVERPMEILEKVGEFAGISVTDSMREAVEVRMGGKVKERSSSDSNKLAATMTTEYYSTVRAPGHRHDGWKRKLDQQEVAAIECGTCGEMMKRLGYQKISS